MKFNEKVDMFIGMAQLKQADVNKLIENIESIGVDVFRNDLKMIKGDYDQNIGRMYDLVDKWVNI